MTTMNNEDPADPSVHEPRSARGETERKARAMLIARLENMQSHGDRWLTVESVLGLLNDCDMLAEMEGTMALSDERPDPADPSVHEPRELPEPAARIASLTNHQGGKWYALEPLVSYPLKINARVYTADQMREAVAAERERSHELLQAADHIRDGLEAKLAALSAALAAKLD